MRKIESIQNPLIKDILKLQDKSRERKKRGLFIVEGKREVNLAIQGNYSIQTILIVNTIFENLDTFIIVLNSIGYTFYTLLILGIILLTVSIVKKENRNSIFYINILGYILFIIRIIYVIIEVRQ